MASHLTTPRHERAFRDYLAMGPDRSLPELADSYDRIAEETGGGAFATLPTLRRWAKQYAWDAQIAPMADAEDMEAELLRLDIVRREHEATVKRIETWDEVQAEHRSRMVQMGHKLLERAGQMLEHPLYQDEIQEDGVSIVRIPIKWQASDVARYIEVADKAIRLAAEMDTSRDKTTVIDETQVKARAEAAGLDKESVLARVKEIMNGKR